MQRTARLEKAKFGGESETDAQREAREKARIGGEKESDAQWEARKKNMFEGRI
jgi:hypothetical protein